MLTDLLQGGGSQGRGRVVRGAQQSGARLRHRHPRRALERLLKEAHQLVARRVGSGPQGGVNGGVHGGRLAGLERGEEAARRGGLSGRPPRQQGEGDGLGGRCIQGRAPEQVREGGAGGLAFGLQGTGREVAGQGGHEVGEPRALLLEGEHERGDAGAAEEHPGGRGGGLEGRGEVVLGLARGEEVGGDDDLGVEGEVGAAADQLEQICRERGGG